MSAVVEAVAATTVNVRRDRRWCRWRQCRWRRRRRPPPRNNNDDDRGSGIPLRILWQDHGSCCDSGDGRSDRSERMMTGAPARRYHHRQPLFVPPPWPGAIISSWHSFRGNVEITTFGRGRAGVSASSQPSYIITDAARARSRSVFPGCPQALPLRRTPGRSTSGRVADAFSSADTLPHGSRPRFGYRVLWF